MTVLAFLDPLGRWKWPSVLAISALPLVSWFASWGSWDAGIGAALYGPEIVAGMPVVLAHRSGADPLVEEEIEWSVRSCAGCEARLHDVRLGYSDCDAAPAAWTAATGAGGRLAATLPRPEMPAQSPVCVWLEVRTEAAASEPHRYRWPLGVRPPLVRQQPGDSNDRPSPQPSPASGRGVERGPACIALAVLLLLGAHAHAQQPEAPNVPGGGSGIAPRSLDPATVTGFRREYRTREAGSALGMDVDALSLPLAITTIPKDLLADQGINNVEEALRNVAGVTRFKEGNGGEEKFSIRGFDASRNLFIDGARLNNSFNATNIATTETANIERFEVLKGPSAILFGSGLPGGVINYVTKKPTFQRYAAAELQLGSFGYKRFEADATAPINDTVAWRGVFSHEDSDGFRDFDSRRRTLLNPTLGLRFGDSTTVNLGYSCIRDQYTQDRGQTLAQAADGTYFYSPVVQPDMFFGIPGFNDRTNSTYQRFNFNLNHQFGERLRLELIGAATKVRKDLFDASGDLVQPDCTCRSSPACRRRLAHALPARQPGSALRRAEDGRAPRARFGRRRRQPQQPVLRRSARQRHGDLRSGHEELRHHRLQRRARPGDDRHQLSDQDGRAHASLQDLMTIADHHIVLLGAGHTRGRDELAGTTVSKTNPRLGYIYKLSSVASLYASYATGFLPSDATGQDGQLLGPEKMRQGEVGFKADLFDQQLLLSGALFDVEQRNQAVTDPASLALPPGQQWSISLGKTRTRGFEAQAIGKLSARWRLIAGYAFLDAKLIDDGPDFDNDGNRLGGIPRHSVNCGRCMTSAARCKASGSAAACSRRARCRSASRTAASTPAGRSSTSPPTTSATGGRRSST